MVLAVAERWGFHEQWVPITLLAELLSEDGMGHLAILVLSARVQQHHAATVHGAQHVLEVLADFLDREGVDWDGSHLSPYPLDPYSCKYLQLMFLHERYEVVQEPDGTPPLALAPLAD